MMINIDNNANCAEVMAKVSNMKYRTCFSSICDSGYSIGLIKSGLQKYLRRREPEKMKWCGKQIYMFNYGCKNELDKKISVGIFSNLKNRIIVMLDEELSFDEVNRYLLIREKIEELSDISNFVDGLNILYDICDIMCSGRLIRLNSDINAYFGRRVVENNIDLEKYRFVDVKECDEYNNCMQNFIGWFKKKDSRCYYWVFKLCNMKDGSIIRYRRKEVIYGVLKYLEGLIGNNKKLRKLFDYRLNSFYDKDKKERKLFLIGIVNIFMYRDEINWDENVEWNKSGIIEDKKIVIDSYCIDMHCKEGRMMGKCKADFIREGCLVVNEYLKYKNDVWRRFYIGEEVEETEVDVKEIKIVVEKIKINKRKIKKENLGNIEKVKVNNKKDDGLNFISMDDLKFVRLCSNSVCGGKVMCFIVRYNDKMYVMKEGRKSMKYNVDYEMVDNCKEIFGLKKIGMCRILSNKIIEKVDKKKKEWENNWRFVNKENVVYCMMNMIDGVKLIDWWRNNDRDVEDEKQFMKIGLWRGIFGVSDFSSVNIMKCNNGDLISIDEHGLLGNRVKMIGDNNMKMYRKNNRFLEDIFTDLYSNKEEKMKWIKNKMIEFGFVNEVDRVLDNYINLKAKFVVEYNM